MMVSLEEGGFRKGRGCEGEKCHCQSLKAETARRGEVDIGRKLKRGAGEIGAGRDG